MGVTSDRSSKKVGAGRATKETFMRRLQEGKCITTRS